MFGGVEHMSTALLRALHAKGHTCHLVSFDSHDAEIYYDIPEGVTWHRISDYPVHQKAGQYERIKRLLALRKIIKKHKIDVSIGFQDGAFLCLALASLGTKIPVIAAERNGPQRFDYIKAGRYRNIVFNSFRLARAVTVQCPSYVAKYPKYLRHKIHVISNPVFMPNHTHKTESKKKKILSVGRLAYQKNHEVLINAFSLLAKDHLDWNLVIVGEGEARPELEKQIETLNLTDRVFLEGYHKSPDIYYNDADIFCLSSRWEGFPNTLAEAMAHGLPCIGFEGCCGTADLIQSGDNGYLAQGNDSAITLKEALKKIIMNDQERIEMGNNARISVEQYAPNNIYDQWENLFIATGRPKLSL